MTQTIIVAVGGSLAIDLVDAVVLGVTKPIPIILGETVVDLSSVPGLSGPSPGKLPDVASPHFIRIFDV